MSIKALCRTEKEVMQLMDKLKEDRRIAYSHAINQQWIDNGHSLNGYMWWKDEQDPVNLPKDVYWQGEMSLSELYNTILICESVDSLLQQCVFEKFFQTKFPNLNWEIIKKEHFFRVRLKGRLSTIPVSLKSNDVEETLCMVESISTIQQYVQELEEQYPYLYFHSGTTELPYTENGSKVTTPYQWEVYIKYNGRDGTHTGFRFDWPITDKIKVRLEELDKQAELASQEGWFFCTKCQTAYPHEQYAGFLYAETRCKVCATPEWKKMAEKENYD